jgi:hypothetical protein
MKNDESSSPLLEIIPNNGEKHGKMEQLVLESQVWDLVENDGCSWLRSAI